MPLARPWIPAQLTAGMTEGTAGMTEGTAGMTEGTAGMTEGRHCGHDGGEALRA